MKKNGEFVGVDEKFIPENEKYVNESLLGDKEKSQKIAKRFGIGYFVMMFIPIIVFIIMATLMMSGNNKRKFNMNFQYMQGERTGADWRLDEVITNNKTNDKHIITVVYKEQTYITEDEIITLKRLLDDITKYQYSVDYDENGYINRITIKDI
jgi:hypothetical protein